MNGATQAAILFLASCIGFLAVRPFSSRIRIVFDTAVFVVTTAALLHWKVELLYPTPAEVSRNDAFWLRGLAAIWWLLGARLLVALLWFTLHRNRRSRQARLFSDLTAATIYITAVLVVLNSVLALPLRGLVTTSGIVAIVLGLALQNTLADVFAGIAVGVEAPFAVGDQIKISDLVEGRVAQLNWRSIHVQNDSGDVAIIPNSLAARSQIVNRTRLGNCHEGSVEFPCPAGISADRVVELALEAVEICPGIVKEPAASAALSKLGIRRNRFTITFYAGSIADLSSIKTSLLRIIRRQLRWSGLLADETRGGDAATSAERWGPLLSELPMFQHLDPEQLLDLAKRLKRRVIAKDAVLFEQGGLSAKLYVVTAGVVAVSRNEGTETHPIGIVGAGDCLGEISLLTGDPYAATATAITVVSVLEIDKDALAPLLERDHVLVANLEASVQHGMAILHRQAVAGAVGNGSAVEPLSERIRRFFHLPFHPETPQPGSVEPS